MHWLSVRFARIAFAMGSMRLMNRSRRRPRASGGSAGDFESVAENVLFEREVHRTFCTVHVFWGDFFFVIEHGLPFTAGPFLLYIEIAVADVAVFHLIPQPCFDPVSMPDNGQIVASPLER